MIDVGDLVIAHEMDRPCARFIAEVVNPKTFELHYLDARVNRGYAARSEQIRLVKHFGVRVVPTELLGFCTIEPAGPSMAVYPNGEPRHWQPQNPEYLELPHNCMSPWIAGYASMFYFRFFSRINDPGSLESYVLPFLQSIRAQEFDSLNEIRQKAITVGSWIEYDF